MDALGQMQMVHTFSQKDVYSSDTQCAVGKANRPVHMIVGIFEISFKLHISFASAFFIDRGHVVYIEPESMPAGLFMFCLCLECF